MFQEGFTGTEEVTLLFIMSGLNDLLLCQVVHIITCPVTANKTDFAICHVLTLILIVLTLIPICLRQFAQIGMYTQTSLPFSPQA